MQQQLGPWTSRGAAGPPSSSGQQRAGFALALRQGGCRRWACASQGNHNAARFRDLRPEQLQLQDRDHLALPAGERDAGRPNSHVLSLAAAPDDWQPRQLWDGEGPPGSFQPANPWVQRFRVRQLRLPGPPTLPGSDYWEVEMLNDYKAELPSVRVTDNHVQLRLGLLGRVHNPPLTPFVYYRGIEHVQYSWVDRVLQTLFVAGYAGEGARARGGGGGTQRPAGARLWPSVARRMRCPCMCGCPGRTRPTGAAADAPSHPGRPSCSCSPHHFQLLSGPPPRLRRRRRPQLDAAAPVHPQSGRAAVPGQPGGQRHPV